MRTLANPEDKQDTLARLAKVQPDHRARWGRMSAHQMLCHLGDSFLAVMGEKYVSSATGPLQRTVVVAQKQAPLARVGNGGSLGDDVGDRQPVLLAQSHINTRHQRK